MFHKMKPRILIITNGLNTGGAQKMSAYVSNTLSDRGFDVTIMTFNHHGEVKWLIDERVKLVHMNFSQDKIGKNKKLLSPITERLKWMKEIRTVTKKINPEIVLAFNVDIITTSKIALLATDYKFVATDRLDPSSYSLIWKILSTVCYTLSDKLIFQTEGAMKCYGKIIQKKSIIIPNPYIRSEYSENIKYTKDKRIVAVGRLSRIKGFDTLIKAFKMVNTYYPDYKLVIYGDGEERENLTKLIKDLKLERSVELPGFVKNIKKNLSDASVYVLSSRSEGLPNALIEAMGVGLPVVSTDCPPGGPRFLIDNKKNGLLVPVDDSERLAEAIGFILSNRKFSERIGKEAKKIQSKLSEEKISQMWYLTLNELITNL